MLSQRTPRVQDCRKLRLCSALALMSIFLSTLLAIPVPARASISFPITIKGNGGQIADSQNGASLMSTLRMTIGTGESLPSSGINTQFWTFFAGYSGVSKSGSTVYAAPSSKLGTVLSSLGYRGLADYTLSELVTTSKSLSTYGVKSPYYNEFAGYAGSGAVWQTFSLTNGDKMEVRLVGVYHDVLSTQLSGYKTKAGLSFMMTHALNTGYSMNTSNTSEGGWASSQLRADLNPATVTNAASTASVWNLLPSDLRNSIVAVNKESSIGRSQTRSENSSAYVSGANLEHTLSKNYLWIPSTDELGIYKYGEGEVYAFYGEGGTLAGLTTSNSGSTIAGASRVWTRSPDDGKGFFSVAGTTAADTNSTSKGCVVLGFCL